MGTYPGSVTLRLHDTATRELRDFEPLTPGDTFAFAGLSLEVEAIRGVTPP